MYMVTEIRLKGTLLVPVGLFVTFVPFSLLIGWNLIKLIIFWFVITPSLAIYLPKRISNNKDRLLQSLLGLIIFYAFMVFMIYDHYKTDYFKIMIFSCAMNLMLVALMEAIKRIDRK